MFGNMVGLWRCHFAVAQVLELLEHRRVEQSAATCVQLLKAIHQTALDHVGWNNAMMLVPWDDPIRPDLFRGDPEEMISAAPVNRGIRDLQSQVGASTFAAHQSQYQQEEQASRRRLTPAERKAAAVARKQQQAPQGQGGSGGNAG